MWIFWVVSVGDLRQFLRSKMTIPDEHVMFYDDLKRQYDIVLERRRTLTDQSTKLIGFAGIIETILIGVLVTLSTDSTLKNELIQTPFYYPILMADMFGFVTYIIAVIFAVISFYEGKYRLAPILPNNDHMSEINSVFTNPATYLLEGYARQVSNATSINQLTNDSKYKHLKVATIFVLMGIIASAIGGLLLISYLI